MVSGQGRLTSNFRYVLEVRKRLKWVTNEKKILPGSRMPGCPGRISPDFMCPNPLEQTKRLQVVAVLLGPQVSYSLNSLRGGKKGDYIGDYYRVILRGDTRSLEYSSSGARFPPFTAVFILDCQAFLLSRFRVWLLGWFRPRLQVCREPGYDGGTADIKDPA